MHRPTFLLVLALAGCKDKPADTGGCDTPTWFADADRDGFGNPERGACEEAPTYVQAGGDCNDDDSSIYPGATEECDGEDNNCDGAIDEGTAGTGTYYLDSDGDGFGDDATAIVTCGQPDGYAAAGGDCDDSDSNVYPNATEYCDDVDADCDGDLNDPDSVDAVTYYADADLDGYGDPGLSSTLCESEPGVVGNDLDCDDNEADVHPNADELCNGADDDCDDVVDEDGINPLAWYPDADRDGYGDPDGSTRQSCSQPSGYTANNEDCDDGNGGVNPGATEVCADGIDNDCSGDGAPCELSGNMLLSVADRVYSGESSGDEAGFSIAPGRGDHNGDGIDDLLVSAAEHNSTTGRVYIFNGPISASGSLGTASVLLDGVASGDAAGLRVSWVSDVNNNGKDEVLVGAWREDTGATNAGAAYLVRGTLSTGSLGAAPIVLLGEDRNDNFGTSVAGVGDPDQDGRGDILVGAAGEDLGGTDSGAAFLFYSPLASGDASSADVILSGASSGDQAGYAVAGGQDLDNDGTVDMLVGAVLADGDASGSGAAYVLSGASVVSMSLGDAPTLTGQAANDYFGWSLAALPDIDGDGAGDVVVGAYNARTNGAAYVFFGPITGDLRAANADIVITGAASGDLFGFAVASAGDPNDDGDGDLLIGAPEAAGAVNTAGAAWLFYGPLSGGVTLGAADAVLQGAARGDSAGSSVGGVGDVNDDGVDDIFLGGYEAGAGGEIYVLFGGAP